MSILSTTIFKFGLNFIGASGLGLAARPFLGGRGAVLMFHHCGWRKPTYFGANDHLSIEAHYLHELLEECRRECIDIISIDEALERVASKDSGNRFVVLTFDDGYRDNVDTAYPILQRFRVPFTIFVCSGFVDRSEPIWWMSLEEIIKANETLVLELDGRERVLAANSKRKKRRAFKLAVKAIKMAEPQAQKDIMKRLCERYNHNALAVVDYEMATWDMLRMLATDENVTIGSHTISHPFLSKLSEDEARREILGGSNRIEEMIGIRPDYFAYPYGFAGAVSERDLRLVHEAGFKAAFTTEKGLFRSENLYIREAIPRVSINGHYQNISAFRALMSGLPFFLNDMVRKPHPARAYRSGIIARSPCHPSQMIKPAGITQNSPKNV